MLTGVSCDVLGSAAIPPRWECFLSSDMAAPEGGLELVRMILSGSGRRSAQGDMRSNGSFSFQSIVMRYMICASCMLSTLRIENLVPFNASQKAETPGILITPEKTSRIVEINSAKMSRNASATASIASKTVQNASDRRTVKNSPKFRRPARTSLNLAIRSLKNRTKVFPSSKISLSIFWARSAVSFVMESAPGKDKTSSTRQLALRIHFEAKCRISCTIGLSRKGFRSFPGPEFSRVVERELKLITSSCCGILWSWMYCFKPVLQFSIHVLRAATLLVTIFLSTGVPLVAASATFLWCVSYYVPTENKEIRHLLRLDDVFVIPTKPKKRKESCCVNVELLLKTRRHTA